MKRRDRSAPGFGCSRRVFVGGMALVAVGMSYRTAAGLAPSERPDQTSGVTCHYLPASVAATGAVIERYRTTAHPERLAGRWRCCSSGAELEVLSGGRVRLLLPGWGERVFTRADFYHGQPQEAVRRRFGETVLGELYQALTGWP